MAKIHIYLSIRHASNLILRIIEWKIAEEQIPAHIIGRRVQELLGSDNKEMLLAAMDGYEEKIDLKARMKEKGNKEKRSSVFPGLFGESVFDN